MNAITRKDFAEVRPILKSVVAMVVMHGLLTSAKTTPHNAEDIVENLTEASFATAEIFMQRVDKEILS